MTNPAVHHGPEHGLEYVATIQSRGANGIFAGVGMAAHLAGALAAHTTLPVIGVPMDFSLLKGMDSLLSMAWMPPGIRVATGRIGKVGAKIASVWAARVLALSDTSLGKKCKAMKAVMARGAEEKAEILQRREIFGAQADIRG